MRFCAWCAMCKYSGMLYDVSNSGPKVCILTLFPAVRWCEYWFRKSYLLKCQWLFRWSGLGSSCRSNMSTLSQCYLWCYCQSILHYHVSVVWFFPFFPTFSHPSSPFWLGLGHSLFSWSKSKKGRYKSESGIPRWAIVRSQSRSDIDLFFSFTLVIVLIECRSLLRRILPCAPHTMSLLQPKWSLLQSLKEVWFFWKILCNSHLV